MQGILALALSILLVSGIVASIYMCSTLRLTYNVLGNLTCIVSYGEELLDNITSGKNTAISWEGYNRYIGYAVELNSTIKNMIYNITIGQNTTTNTTMIQGNSTQVLIIIINGTATRYSIVDTAYVNGTLELIVKRET